MRGKSVQGGLTAPKPRYLWPIFDFLALQAENQKKIEEFEQWVAGYDPQVVAMHISPLAAILSSTARGSSPEPRRSAKTFMKGSPSITKVSTIGYIFSLIFIVWGCTWFIRGEVIFPNKGVYMYGTQARLFSFLFIIMWTGLGLYPFIKYQWKHSKAGGSLLLLGLIIGVLIVGFIETHYSTGWPLLIGYIATLLLSLPGLIVSAMIAEAYRQKQMNQSAEQSGPAYPPQSVGSADP